MTRRIGFPAALLASLALALPGAALGVLLSVEGEGSGLVIVVQPPGSGVVFGPGIYCEDECSYEIEGGVTLTAEARPGYRFKSWGRCDKTGVNGRKCTVTGPANEIVAKFVKIQDLTVSKAEGSGLGKVSSSPGGIVCVASCTSVTSAFLQGASVKLKQAPARHFHFVEWLGDCTGAGLCEVPMDEDREVEARFAEDPKQSLTLTKVGVGQGIVRSRPAGVVCIYVCSTVEAAFYEGETVVLKVPKVGGGSTFEGWSGCDAEPEGNCEVTVDAAKAVTATFG